MIEQMAPRDAQMYWTSPKIPNDQFLLYCFSGPTDGPDAVRGLVHERARRIADLRIRALDVPAHLDYPYWVPRDESQVPVVVHALADTRWRGCLDAVAELLTTTVDIRECPWRLHLFPDVTGAPYTDGEPALVAVLQVSHALADGQRASAAARALFGPDESLPDPLPQPPRFPALQGVARFPVKFGRLLGVSRAGFVAYKRQQELVASGELAPEPAGFELTAVNCDPGAQRSIRTIVGPRDDLRGSGVTVTVGVLAAIATALPRYLRECDQCPPERMGAELTVAETGDAIARNHFRNLGIDLACEEPDPVIRAHRIADTVQRRRERAGHPVIAAQRAGGSALPAPLMWAGVQAFSPTLMPPTVAGNTVVSSVVRGAADLRLAGGQVVFTAGFPALSPVMGLTHGVHGIGDTVTVSVLTSTAVISDADHYANLLAASLAEVGRALR